MASAVTASVTAMKRTCDTCREPFDGRSDARYCSDRCRQQAHRSQGDGAVKAFAVPEPERARIDAENEAIVADALELRRRKRANAGQPPATREQLDGTRDVSLRNAAIARTALPVPETGRFGAGKPLTGRSVVRFDPETGNVVGHGHDCLCELCDPIGRKAALRQ